MKTLLVSGSDTGVGKTWVSACLALALVERGRSVQVVKVVETGVAEGETGDVEWVLGKCESELVSGYTLRRYREPIAPLAAAELEGRSFCIEDLVAEIGELPDCDWRIVEGAGSVAVPLESSGRDWADFGKLIEVDKAVLVVADKLGAIGQARMALSYAKGKGLEAGVWLNEVGAQDEVTRKATHEGLNGCEVPVWGVSRFGVIGFTFDATFFADE
ncbi:MAG: dethiobiotin synthase [Verrucomicrobiota bacterium]